MTTAFREALKGGNRTLSNPLVGAVVVKKGKIISKGHHAFFGGPHAEEMALKKAGKKAKGADLYITLEPCSSTGKRPPCTDLIIQYGIKNVFFASPDVHPLNAGKAVKSLRSSGITARQTGTRELLNKYNAPFVKGIRQSMPYVFLKAAMSMDGKLCDSRGQSRWITSPESRHAVHDLRSRVNAVLVGARTFQTDNPRLNIRIPVKRKYDEPVKIIVTSSGNLDISHNLIRSSRYGRVLIATTRKGKARIEKKIKKCPKHLTIESFPSISGKISLKKLLQRLYMDHHISSLLVEGGAKTLTSFIQQGLYDSLSLFLAPRFFGTGKKSLPLLSVPLPESAGKKPVHTITRYCRSGPDLLVVLERNS